MPIERVAFGVSINDIVFPDGSTRIGVLGGGGPQAAWGMATALNSGITVGLAAKVGADLPPSFFAPLEAAEINLDGIRETELPTPRSWQIMKFDGTRTHIWRVPMETLVQQMERSWDILPASYQKAYIFHWGIDTQNCERDISNAKHLNELGLKVSLEPYRVSDTVPIDTLRRILEVCEVFSPNWLEAAKITGQNTYRDIVESFREFGCSILALRRDQYGADVWNLREGWGVRVPAVQVRVVDVIGAGNTFCGGFIARLDDGIKEAACHASVVASYMIEQVGLPLKPPNPVEYARRIEEVRAGVQILSLDSII